MSMNDWFGCAAPRQFRANPYQRAIPQYLRNPHIRANDLRVPNNSRTARRPSTVAARGPASLSEFPMNSPAAPTADDGWSGTGAEVDGIIPPSPGRGPERSAATLPTVESPSLHLSAGPLVFILRYFW